jgi:hypothetical protein
VSETYTKLKELQMTCSRCRGEKVIQPWRETITCGMCGGRGFVVREFPSSGMETITKTIWEEHVNSRDEVIECVERILSQFDWRGERPCS